MGQSWRLRDTCHGPTIPPWRVLAASQSGRHATARFACKFYRPNARAEVGWGTNTISSPNRP
jgi:hypothetical protein